MTVMFDLNTNIMILTVINCGLIYAVLSLNKTINRIIDTITVNYKKIDLDVSICSKKTCSDNCNKECEK